MFPCSLQVARILGRGQVTVNPQPDIFSGFFPITLKLEFLYAAPAVYHAGQAATVESV